MKGLQIGPWRGYDPRDADWHCDYCGSACPNGPRDCLSCHRARLLTEEEEEQVRKSEHSGEELYGRVLVGEYLGDELESWTEYNRQWNKMLTQVIIIADKRYLLIAIRSEKDKELANYMLAEDWLETGDYKFSESKLLDSITREICNIICKNEGMENN